MPWFLRVTVCGLVLLLTSALRAQVNPVHEIVASFSAPAMAAPSTGALTLASDGYYWGTTSNGGPYYAGTVYKLKADGSDPQVVVTFTGADGPNPGINPTGLTVDGAGYLWGTTYSGGASGKGTIFKLNINTSTLTTLVQFTGQTGASLGANPSSLVSDGLGSFWGTTVNGGTPGSGTVFKINATTAVLTTVSEFTGSGADNPGYNPATALVYDGAGFFWGSVSWYDGTGRYLRIFKVQANTGVLTKVTDLVENFVIFPPAETAMVNDGVGSLWGVVQNSDGYVNATLFRIDIGAGTVSTFLGAVPSPTSPSSVVITLTSDGAGSLWGTSSRSGTGLAGTLFRINIPSHSGLTVAKLSPSGPRHPLAPLVSDGAGSFLGTTSEGGSNGSGAVIKLNSVTGVVTTLWDLGQMPANTPSGRVPTGGLVDDETGWLWGTASNDGVAGYGTIYKVNISSGELITVVQFTKNGATNKGAYPRGSLVSDGAGFLWGTTDSGGVDDIGTIFKINVATGILETILSFPYYAPEKSNYYNGSHPYAELVSDGAGYLWGTTYYGGTSGYGTVFKVNIATGAFSSVLSFTENTGSRKGAHPSGGLVNTGTGFMIGATTRGGSSGKGTVFKVNVTTEAFTTLVEFLDNGTTNKGNAPTASLTSDGTGGYWGTTSKGGAGGFGTVFRVNATDAGQQPYTVIEFTGNGANNKGRNPNGALVNDGQGCLWGTTTNGGALDQGTVFKIDSVAGTLTTVMEFTGMGSQANAGANPMYGALFKNADGDFYGTTSLGGPGTGGTVFRLHYGPRAITGASTAVSATSTTLHGTVSGNGGACIGYFDYGTAPDALTQSTTPQTVNPNEVAAMTQTLSGLAAGTTYYYRMHAYNAALLPAQRDQLGAVLSFIAQAPTADLAGLTLSVEELSPAFDAAISSYSAVVPYTVTSVKVKPVAAEAGATLAVNGAAVASGDASGAIALMTGSNVINIIVSAPDSAVTRTYTVGLTRSQPLPGDLDLSFGGLAAGGSAAAGKVLTGFGSTEAIARAVAMQKDGKIVVAGECAAQNGIPDVALARYNADGRLDTSFGTGGKVIADGGSEDSGRSVAIQTDGKILVAGRTVGPGFRDFGLLRFNANGTPDTTFGNGGRVTTDFADGNAYNIDYGQCMALQTDGKILVAGFSRSPDGISVARYLTNGSIDASFGTGGKVSLAHSMNSGFVSCNAMALQGDGKILLAGSSRDDAGQMCASIVRVLSNGSMDSSFGSYGVARVSIGTSSVISDVKIQGDGKIVAVGDAYIVNNEYNTNLAIMRFNVDGSPDSSFGESGKVKTAFMAFGRALSVQSDGKLVAAGYVGPPDYIYGNNVITVVRFQINGSVDATFGTGGQLLTAMGTHTDLIHSHAYGMTAQSDGQIIVVGDYQDPTVGGYTNFAVVRYNALPVPLKMEVFSQDGAPISSGGGFSFGNVGVGIQRSATFTIKNTGSQALSGLTISKGGDDAGVFTVTADPAASINGPYGSTTFTVRFAPTAVGDKSAMLHIASNDASHSPIDIALTGAVAAPVVPLVTTLAADGVSGTNATLHGSVNAQGSAREVTFEYGLTTAYGATIKATPETVTGSEGTDISAALTNLSPHQVYHFRAVASGGLGSAKGQDLTFSSGNAQPAAVADDFAIMPGMTTTLGVLSNDTDADKDVLSITAFTPLDPPSAGTLTKSNTAFVFRPSSSFIGAKTATFSYTISDGFGKTSTAQVSLSVGSCAIDPATTSVGYAAPPYPITVTANGTWTVTETLPWVAVSTLSGVDNGTVTVTLQANLTKTDRTGTINIGGVIHTVTQTGILKPSLSLPVVVPQGLVSAPYAMAAIPTAHGPVTYAAVSGMPAGLAIGRTNGIISGTPTKGAEQAYQVKIRATNAAGASDVLTLPILIKTLPEGVVGAFQGFIEGDSTLNGGLGSRFELTVTATGAATGKIITGAASQPLKGQLLADVSNRDYPELYLTIPRTGQTALNVILDFDATADSIAEIHSVSGAGSDFHLHAWRNTWNASNHKATDFSLIHSFTLDVDPPAADKPQGHGYGSFTVKEINGSLTATGKLPDGNAFTSATFLGSQGQVLLYQSLYGNKGSLGGILTVTKGERKDNTIAKDDDHTLTWFKPGPQLNSKDTIYREGFTLDLKPEGGVYVPPGPGKVALSLPNNTDNNARLDFSLGGLDVEGKTFGIDFGLFNPSNTGLTNKVAMPPFNLAGGVNLNRVNLPVLTVATGLFSGDFTLSGSTVPLNRKVTFQGQIVKHGARIQGYGFFLLPELPRDGQTPASMTKHSGSVILKAAK